MKRAVTILAVLTFALSVGLLAQAPNFAGTWKLNAEKSEMGGGGRMGGRMGGGMMGGELVVKQTAAELSVTRGENTSVYKLDGSESTNQGMRGETKSKARVDGSTIVIDSTSSFEGPNGAMTITSKEVWSMDGGSLVITTTRTTPRGERTTKMVYDKQ
jgi:hypothetical protein